MIKQKFGFTLAEVLIVIGIIGVVAALTLPNLNHATGDKETVTKVKKVYSNLTEAVDRAQAIYGPVDTWFKDLNCDDGNNAICSERFAKRVTEFMKVSKDCGFGDGCFSSAPLLFTDGEEFEENYLESLQSYNNYMLVLSDEMSIAFWDDNIFIFKIRVDIDGPNKGKNQEGVDIFDFSIYVNSEWASAAQANVNQLYPSGSPINCRGSLSENSTSYRDNYVTAWVIENGNLDYLKCYDQLNWETKTSCE